ncbi:MAG: hypothetical protein GW942_00660 [Candidatus Pacebacteria bacterium]|nr:hypothetical protein [Candidatus Paceibacterota bacterium]
MARIDDETIAVEKLDKMGSMVPRKDDKEIHKKIRECQSHNDLLKLFPNKQSIKEADPKSLALIIEGSGCHNIIGAYMFGVEILGIDELIKDSNMLLQLALDVYKTPEFSVEAHAQFGGRNRMVQ